MKTAEYKRLLNKLLGKFRGEKTRARDNCPEWVKAEALEKAKQKRKMRADKLRAIERRG